MPLRATGALSREYLLAAFVRTIFPSLNPFLRNRRDRHLLGAQICPTGGSEMFSGSDLAMIYEAPGYHTGSSSPKKRQATTQSGPGVEIPRGHPQAVSLDPLYSDNRKRWRSSEDCVKEEQYSGSKWQLREQSAIKRLPLCPGLDLKTSMARVLAKSRLWQPSHQSYQHPLNPLIPRMSLHILNLARPAIANASWRGNG